MGRDVTQLRKHLSQVTSRQYLFAERITYRNM